MDTARKNALEVLAHEFRSERGSLTAIRRAIRSCKTLNLSEGETIHVLALLDYCDAEGNPFGRWKDGWPPSLLPTVPAEPVSQLST